MNKIEPETWKIKTTDSDQRGGERGITGERRGRASNGTRIEDSWVWTIGGIDCESGGARLG